MTMINSFFMFLCTYYCIF